MRSNTQLLIALLALTGGARAGDDARTTQSSPQPSAVVTHPEPEFSDSDRAHWRHGEVRIDGTWGHFSQVGVLTHRKAQLQKYRELRSDRGSSIEDQLSLADECRKLQLPDEERTHLEQVVRQSPNHTAARERLGDQLFEGSWLSRRDQQKLKTRLADLVNAEKRYGIKIRTAAERLDDSKRQRRDAAQKVLEAIQDPAAIPLMEQTFGYNTEESQMVYLDWLNRIPSWKSSAAIARLSLISESPLVRVATSKTLRERPWEEFVPVFMSELTLPTEVKTEIVQFGDWAQLTMVASTETGDMNRVTVAISRYTASKLHIHYARKSKRYFVRSMFHSSAEFPAGIRELQVLALREADQIAVRDSDQAIRNERTCRLLSNSLGLQGTESPSTWWKWWDASQGYTDILKPQVFSSYEETWHYEHGKRQVGPPRIRRTVGSCFVAGTMVQAESGLVPIESIKIGDRVLSQDVETGELAYKPVLRTTVRESKDTRVIQAGDDQLRCSPGHPFWVKGQGWVQAHNLSDQSQFHTITGAMPVSSVKEDLGATVYNLEVADFNTYFVGNTHILSHDVTVREPTDMVEPGIIKTELAAYGGH